MGILSLHPRDKSIETIVDRYHGERLKGANDLIVDADGVIYFADQGMTGLHDLTGSVFHLFPNGRLELILSNGPSPNGLVFNRDKSSLFVAMTRENAVWHIPFFQDGSVQGMGRFPSYYGIGGPDGMALDEEGNVFVAHSTLGAVFIHRPNGEPMAKIKKSYGSRYDESDLGGRRFEDIIHHRERDWNDIDSRLALRGLPVTKLHSVMSRTKAAGDDFSK